MSLALAGSRPPPELQRTVSANSVGVMDSEGHLLGQVGVGTSPTALSSGGGAVWVVNQSDDTVMRIDPVTLSVTQRFVVGDNPAAVVATDEDVWVANFGDGTVTRINIAGNRITQPAIPVGGRPTAIAEGAGGVWVANSADNTVQRIDAKTGVPGTAVDVGEGPDGLLVTEESLWVANGRDGTLSRLGLRSGAVVAAPLPVGSGPRGLARAAGDVWVADQLSQSVTRVSATDRTRPVYVADGPTAVAELGGAIWVASQYDGSLTRIDPETEQQTTIPLDGSPLALAAHGGRLWVSVGAAGRAEHRGGALTVAAARIPGWGLDGIDPSVAYSPPTVWAERLVYEGLVALRYFGEDPQTLVPNLATAIPLPSDGGRTYTFQLRPGLRYSTGLAVKASDFQGGMERALAGSGGSLFVGVVGGPECVLTPEKCDLSRGVEVDDPAGRVTFHLAAPDPDFLYKLTLFVMPTPDGSEWAAYGVPPGTGPYVISRYVRGEVFELARNPYFTQTWSVPATPEGYPDVIRWVTVADAASAVARWAGKADLAELKRAGDSPRSSRSWPTWPYGGRRRLMSVRPSERSSPA